MIEKIIELLRDGWAWLAPFHVCFPYEGGVVLRFGRYHRDIRTGWNWKLPLAEYVVDCYTCEDTEQLTKQRLTTKDNVQVELSTVVRYKIVDPRKYLLDVQDQKTALVDVTKGLARRAVEQATFDELVNTEWDRAVAEKLRRRVEKYGIQVLEVTYADLGRRLQVYVTHV